MRVDESREAKVCMGFFSTRAPIRLMRVHEIDVRWR